MKEHGLGIDVMRVPPGRIDGAIEVLLIPLLAFMLLAFGARSAWSEEVVVALSGAIVICFLLKVLFNGGQCIRLLWRRNSLA